MLSLRTKAVAVASVGLGTWILLIGLRRWLRTRPPSANTQPSEKKIPKVKKRQSHRRGDSVTIETSEQVLEDYCKAKTPSSRRDNPYMPIYESCPSLEGRNWIGSKVTLPPEVHADTSICGIGYHPEYREEANARAALQLCQKLMHEIIAVLPEYSGGFKNPPVVYNEATASLEKAQEAQRKRARATIEKEQTTFAKFLSQSDEEQKQFRELPNHTYSGQRIPVPLCGTSVICRSCDSVLTESKHLMYPLTVKFPDRRPLSEAERQRGSQEFNMLVFHASPTSSNRFFGTKHMNMGDPLSGFMWYPICCKKCRVHSGYSFRRGTEQVDSFHGLDSRYCGLRMLEEVKNERINYDKYQPLGSGSEGKAFRGTYRTETGTQLAAIKQIPLNDDKKKQRVLRELLLMQKAQHPNLITYFDHSNDGLHMHVAMELAHSNLEDWVLHNKDLLDDTGVVCHLTNQLLLGLKHLHHDIDECRYFAHRDLKPQNVLVFIKKESIELKLCDFGLSKSWEELKEDSITGTGFVGTLAWVAPEIFQHPLDRNVKNKDYLKSDVWSMGAVIAFIHSKGIHPYQQSKTFNASDVHANVGQNNRRPWVGQEKPLARDLIDCMLDHDTSKRWTVKECLGHPYFWSERDGRSFIERVYKGGYPNELANATFIDLSNGRTWEQEIPPEMQKWAGNTWKNYTFVSIESFVRFIGNFLKHDQEKKNPHPEDLLGDHNAYEFIVERWPQMMIWLGHTWTQEQRINKGVRIQHQLK